MDIASFSIKRPVLIVCAFLLMIVIGLLSIYRLPVDQFPDVKIPYIQVFVVYPGAGPAEMETLVAKPIEDEVRTISGVKNVNSYCGDSYLSMFVEFSLDSVPAEAEQSMRAKVAVVKGKLPKEAEEPVIRRFDFSDQPILRLALQGNEGVSVNAIYGIADTFVRPKLEQVSKVSQVLVLGGSKREIQVLLDRGKIKAYKMPVIGVSQAIGMAGQNIPLGKKADSSDAAKEYIYRSLGEFNTLEDIKNVVVKFAGNDVPVKLSDLGVVNDTFADELSRAYVNGKRAVAVDVYRQSGSNTVAVASDVRKRVEQIKAELKTRYPEVNLVTIRDGSRAITANIWDVGESIVIGILLTVLVVFLFLGSLRSTFITGIALPNSLICAFVFILVFGFSINMLTLLALSLVVGLLVDDAIVVRENIFRHIQKLKKPPVQAAVEGTNEVAMAVIATTFAIISVFGPIAFVGGIIGMFLRQFGLTVVFVMLISLMDSLTMGPMLSAKFAGEKKSNSFVPRMWRALTDPPVRAFERFQDWLVRIYEKLMHRTIKLPWLILALCLVLFAGSIFVAGYLPKTFLPPTDNGEFMLKMETPPGTSLDKTEEIGNKAYSVILADKEVAVSTFIVGNGEGAANTVEFYVKLRPWGERKIRSSSFKEVLRKKLADFSAYHLSVTDYDVMFGGQKPFELNLTSMDQDLLLKTSDAIIAELKKFPGFSELDIDYRSGKPEMRVIYDDVKAKQVGVSTSMAGAELRAQMEGTTPAKFREKGEEWDIRVRLQDSDRDLKKNFAVTSIPNMNYRLVSLSQVSRMEEATGPSFISRRNGLRAVNIGADVAAGYGVGDLQAFTDKVCREKKLIPQGVSTGYMSAAEQYSDMAQNMALAAFLAVIFIYMVLSSLYNSFITPFSLLLPLPLAISGALLALWIGGQSLNMFSIIAIIMLLGVATKNSILLVDYTNQLLEQGMELKEAIILAGKTRLRPIIMTSVTLVAGTLPLAIGLNEASKSRASMGYVIIGGVITSTLLTLVVVPAVLVLFGKRKGGLREEALKEEKGKINP